MPAENAARNSWLSKIPRRPVGHRFQGPLSFCVIDNRLTARIPHYWAARLVRDVSQMARRNGAMRRFRRGGTWPAALDAVKEIAGMVVRDIALPWSAIEGRHQPARIGGFHLAAVDPQPA